MAELKNVNLKVNPNLWQEAKLEAIRQWKTLMLWVAEAIGEKLLNGQKGGDKDAKG